MVERFHQEVLVKLFVGLKRRSNIESFHLLRSWHLYSYSLFLLGLAILFLNFRLFTFTLNMFTIQCTHDFVRFLKNFFLKYSLRLQLVENLASCGLQSCLVLLKKGYPDIGWNPLEGERYLDFLKNAVFVNGK